MILKAIIIAKHVIKRVSDVKGRAVLWIVISVLTNFEKPVPSDIMRTRHFRNHGTPRQKRMSKMLEPIELQMAILARPAFFTTK